MADFETGLLEHFNSWPVANFAAIVVNFSTGRTVMLGDRTKKFHYASVTKIASTLAFLAAVSEGVFALDQTLLGRIVVRDLMGHSSGLGSDVDPNVDIFDQQPVVAPRTRRIYSSAGFEFLARWLEVESGIRFDQYVKEVLLDSAGMVGSNLSGENWPGAGSTGAAAGMVGNIIDLHNLAIALYQGTPHVDMSYLEQAKTPYLPQLPGVLPGFGLMDANTWGLGFEIRGNKSPHWTSGLNSELTYGHFGASGTFLWIDPEVKIAFGVLTDKGFGVWAQKSWPLVSTYVLENFS